MNIIANYLDKIEAQFYLALSRLRDRQQEAAIQTERLNMEQALREVKKDFYHSSDKQRRLREAWNAFESKYSELMQSQN